MPRYRYRWILLSATALLLGALAAGSAPAAAAQGEVFLEIVPTTVVAGDQISIRGNCAGDNANLATIRSRAFGDNNRLTVSPDQYGLLIQQVGVPTDVRPGDYTITLECADRASVSVDIYVLDMAKPTQGPATGGGGTATGPKASILVLAFGLTALTSGGALLFRSRRRPS